MKKNIPLVIAILSVVFFLGLILKNEQHLKHSDSIYIQLAPVDPRSLIQGDYMVLNYDLSFYDVAVQKGDPHIPMNATAIKNKSSVVAYVALDAQRRVVKTSLDPRLLEMYPSASHRIVLKNPDNRLDRLYPASNSFLFAEGLAECYQAAQYAEFKVDERGNAILASLRGGDLKSLGCEKNKKWWNGNLPVLMHKD
ncbi:GDYXXLXY domain-containing protein [Acinetobacter sp. WCHAc010052]|uniref:GDYXXLXY domain-containing protein n=1 Tax=Acinetobacter sp. WCHAc010052 TaxID=2004647 RepID=UPI000B3C78A8|nr:GDYXXLXY domain-containing protein [Acinetobacter sp. WCHAc010052]AXY59439.1 GDYXXLXY protein [Acinetobacter sp. WCHAc010052]